MENDQLQIQYNTRYIANRIARTIGHVKLVRRMVEQGYDCSDVLIQIAAVRGQLDSICSNIMVQYTDQVVDEYRRSGDPVILEQFKTELTRAIKK